MVHSATSLLGKLNTRFLVTSVRMLSLSFISYFAVPRDKPNYGNNRDEGNSKNNWKSTREYP